MKLIKTIAILLVIIAVFGGAMYGINFYTGPIIEANNAGAVFAPLLAVMPEGAAFDGDALIYDSADAAASSLTGVPASILTVYKEANGLGYAIRVTAEKNTEIGKALSRILFAVMDEKLQNEREELLSFVAKGL